MRKSILGACGCFCLLVGCATGGTEEPAQSDTVKTRVLELQQQAVVTEEAIHRLERRVAELESRVGERRNAPAPQAVTEPAGEPAPAAAAIEVEELAAESLPLSPFESPAQVPIPDSGQAIYDRGYTLYHEGRYLDAETQFQKFLQGYPDTHLADNAVFWIGASRLARGDLTGAVGAFSDTVENYPEGNKVPDSLLKLGQCLEELGDRDGARLRYQEVMRRFPSSAAAVSAEERLAELP
jgi:tol-pal system protein YbgF